MNENQFEDVVKSIIQDIESKLNSRIEQSITDHVNKTLAGFDFESKINLLTSLKLDSKIAGIKVNLVDVEAKVNDQADKIISSITQKARSQISADIARKLDTIDFNASVVNAVAQQVENRLTEIVFPKDSITFDAIKKDEIHLSGDNIVGGIIQNFSSTGIDDRATSVAVTIIDEHTIVENNLIAATANVKGVLTVEGDLIVKGTLPTDSPAFKSIVLDAKDKILADINDTLFAGFSDIIFKQIQQDGIDLDRITIAGDEIIVGNRIGMKITESNLQKVGVVKDFQSSGETFLSEVLYVNQKRVGINTIEPGHALSIWDQEIEIVAAKKKENTAMVGTVRQQELVLSSNNKNNIVCKTDGSVAIANLVLGDVAMSSATTTPVTDQPRGTVVWNARPDIGQPVGWISLGSARWAKFGIIEE